MARSDFTYFWEASSPFSQWYPCEFYLESIKFNCAEQAMMYLKAILFEDDKIAEQILLVTTETVKGTGKCFQKTQKDLGREVRNYDENVWKKHRESIIYKINYAKFSQNTKLLKALLKTAGTTLVEASPFDDIWGIGLRAGDQLAADRSTWKGLNLLGEILTLVRNDLINE